jgi:hypothetical protein
MAENRPDIPEPLKRQVRQRCGFGCVICGVPVYHYDHLEEYSRVRLHELENLVLLCPNHHQDKTSGRLPRALLAKAAFNPRNLSHPRTSAYRFFMGGEETNFWVGGNLFSFRFGDIGTNVFKAIVISGTTVMGMRYEDGNLLFDLLLSDRTGTEILRVEQGELMVSTGVWDYRIEGATLEIRSGTAQIEAAFSFLDDGIRVERGFFGSASRGIIVEPQRYVVVPFGHSFTQCRFSQCLHGIVM